MQITHYGIAPHHRLPVELQDQPKKPVHGRVLRPHAHIHGLEAKLIAHLGVDETATRPSTQSRILCTALFAKHLLPQPLKRSLGAYLEALQKRVVVKVVLPHVQPPQVRVPLEGYPEHVVSLTLMPVGGRIHTGDARHDGLFTLDRGLHPHAPPTQVQQFVSQLEGALPVPDRDEREVKHSQGLACRGQHRWYGLWVDHDPHDVAVYRRVFEGVEVAQTLQVALQAGPQISLRQRYRHFRYPPASCRRIQLRLRPGRSSLPPRLSPRRRLRRSPERPSQPSPFP